MANDFMNGLTQGTNYMANHIPAPQNIQGSPMYNVEIGEGNNPPGDYFPAGYLPAQLSENRIGGSYFVLMPGKVLTFDSTKRLVPAGYIIDSLAATGSRSIKYTALDTQAGTIDATGAFANAGDEVVTEVLGAGITFADAPIGIARYSALAAPGSDPSDPSTFYRHAYDTGGAKAFTRWAYIQVPVVETQARVESVASGQNTVRLALYPAGGGSVAFPGEADGELTIKAGATTKNLTRKANAGLLTPAASGATEPTQYTLQGRTVIFNLPVPDATWTVTYTPKVDLPFTCIQTSSAATVAGYIGKQVEYDVNSNFKIGTTTGRRVGRILDMKEGSSKDLALVRTYFRDFGLWQEAPGSATDGRNAILSIANAPKFIARIAVNFNVPVF